MRFLSHGEKRGVPSADPYDADDEAASEDGMDEVKQEAGGKRHATSDNDHDGKRGEHGGLDAKLSCDSYDKRGDSDSPKKNGVEVGDETRGKMFACKEPAKVRVDHESSEEKAKNKYAHKHPSELAFTVSNMRRNGTTGPMITASPPLSLSLKDKFT